MTRFTHACEQGDVLRAETAARVMGRMSLPNALRLLSLYAAADSPKFDAAAVRFLGRLTEERRDTTLSSMQLAAAALAELRTWRRHAAAETLYRML